MVSLSRGNPGLLDVGSTQVHPTNVYEDNLTCIAVSTNPVHRKSSRHIDMRVHYCRELYTAAPPGVMKLIPLRTHIIVADALTKSLPGPALSKHRDIMRGHVLFLARLLHCGSQPLYARCTRFLQSALSEL